MVYAGGSKSARVLEQARAGASVHWPLHGAMSVRFSDGRCRNLTPLDCGGAGHTDEQGSRQMGCLSMFANVDPSNCQTLCQEGASRVRFLLL
jgi:hypothetical protein